MHQNLKKEMKKRKVTQQMLADLFSGRQATINYKIKYHKFFVNEALLIRNTYFPDLEIDYLFAIIETEGA